MRPRRVRCSGVSIGAGAGGASPATGAAGAATGAMFRNLAGSSLALIIG